MLACGRAQVVSLRVSELLASAERTHSAHVRAYVHAATYRQSDIERERQFVRKPWLGGRAGAAALGVLLCIEFVAYACMCSATT